MASSIRLANEAWEIFFRAQRTIELEFAAADVWDDVLPREYAVLYALSTAPNGLRITELGDDVLLTQPGMSRLVGRLEARGLVERQDDPADARACRIRLSAAGIEMQRRVGRAHAKHVERAMTRALSNEQLETLRELSGALLVAAQNAASE